MITCTDSGGVLAYVEDGHNGLIVEPEEDAIAGALNRLVKEGGLRDKLAANCKLEGQTASWDEVIEALTSPLRTSQTTAARTA